MGLSGSTAWRAVSALAAATLAAGLVGALGGAAVRAQARALVSPSAATPRPGARPASPARIVPSGGGAAAGSAADDAQAAVAAAVAPFAAGRPADSVSVAALDTTTGVRVGWGADAGMTTASVIKLLLLEGYLLQDQDTGRAPGDGHADGLAAMVENSDNDAADQVYAALGGRAEVTALLHRLGLAATVLDAQDRWGLSTTSAADQLIVLTDLVSKESPLSSASRAYALALMSNVESDQRWGVGAAADPGTDFANKNGWLDVDDDGGRWVASSVGVLQVGGHQVLLAVLTQHDTDLADGVEVVELLSRTVAATLRQGR